MNRFKGFRLALISVLGLGMVFTTLPQSYWERKKRQIQCAFDYQNKYKCTKKEKREGTQMVIIGGVATGAVVAAGVGAGAAGAMYYRSQKRKALLERLKAMKPVEQAQPGIETQAQPEVKAQAQPEKKEFDSILKKMVTF